MNMIPDFIELTDRTIINVSDIILLNVDNLGGEYSYKLYIRGKGMTLKLTEEDYKTIRNKIIEEI